MLPAYCCESMILPFIQLGIDVQFYQVQYDHIDYPYDNDADVVFLIDFFGYINLQNSQIACREKRMGKAIIYDSTHKIDGNPNVQDYADYSFCSYRKWFYCNYARAIRHRGRFDNDKKLMRNERYVEIRDEAAREKANYLAGLTCDKESFLSKFNVAEEMLDNDYVGYAGVPIAFDGDTIVSKHRDNALYLTDELRKIPEIKLWRDNVQPDDTPMFVPILVEPSVRHDLRRTLINEGIYCPVHWERSSYHQGHNVLYDRELSLVCDQRYDVTDMEYMIHVIKEYFNQ